jgi:dTDP-glucose 4,6-dehydratase
MTTIITGGTGFIGGNFIHYYMKSHPALYNGPLVKTTSEKNIVNHSVVDGCDFADGGRA